MCWHHLWSAVPYAFAREVSRGGIVGKRKAEKVQIFPAMDLEKVCALYFLDVLLVGYESSLNSLKTNQF